MAHDDRHLTATAVASSSSFIIHEGVFEGMAFILRMRLLVDYSPCAVVGEEGVGMGRRVVHLRQTQTVGQRHRLLVDAGSTYYIYVLLRRAALECGFEGGVDVAARQLFHRRRQHHVAAVGQCALGQRQVGVAPHDDGMAGGELFEPFQVIGQPVDEFVLETDGPVFSHRCNDGNHDSSEFQFWRKGTKKGRKVKK